MVSFVDANFLFENQILVKDMICMEMIGYYNTKSSLQYYPIPGMTLKYGNNGNFITIVQNKKR